MNGLKQTTEGQHVPDVREIWSAMDDDGWKALGIDRGLRAYARDWDDAWTTLGAFPWHLYVFDRKLSDDPAFERLGELVHDALEPINAKATEQVLTAIQHAVEAFAREYEEQPVARVFPEAPAAA